MKNAPKKDAPKKDAPKKDAPKKDDKQYERIVFSKDMTAEEIAAVIRKKGEELEKKKSSKK